MLDDLIEDAKIETAGADKAPAVAKPPVGSPAVSKPAIVKGRLKGIAVVGSHPVTVMDAPFGDEGWLIYACSPDNTPYGDSANRRTLPRHDQWFELHAPIEHPTRPYGYLQYVAQLPVLWMRDRRALATRLFKGARAYPQKELFGTCVVQKRQVQVADGVWQEQRVALPVGDGLFCPYMFTSSIAYIMAKAIVDIEALAGDGRFADGPPKLGLWGILQSSDREYASQRDGTRYFLWEAARRGIDVSVAPESRLAERPEDNW
jgi:hypothetical protein